MYELYLAHYGILGQRWGIRRFQNKDGSLTSAGQSRYGEKGSGKSARHKPSNARKLQKQRIKNLEKARQAKMDKKQFEEEKKKALETGSAADVLKFKGKLTNQELQSAVSRINLEQQLMTMNQKTVKNGWDKTDSLMNKVGKVTDYANKAIAMYNVIAKVHNSFIPEDSQMKSIDGTSREKSAEASKIEKLVRTGSKEDILKNLGKLDSKQLDNAMKRLKYEEQLQKKS